MAVANGAERVQPQVVASAAATQPEVAKAEDTRPEVTQIRRRGRQPGTKIKPKKAMSKNVRYALVDKGFVGNTMPVMSELYHREKDVLRESLRSGKPFLRISIHVADVVDADDDDDVLQLISVPLEQ